MNDNWIALRVHCLSRGHFREVDFLVNRLLAAFGVDLLGEITLRIEKANTYKRQTHIARLFAVIAAEDPEASAVDRQRFVQSKLRTEVGDQLVLSARIFAFEPGVGVILHIGVELL